MFLLGTSSHASGHDLGIHGFPSEHGHLSWERLTPDSVVPIDHSSIQSAINAADAGDTILVLSGTYPEAVVINRPVYLVGADIDAPHYLMGVRTSFSLELPRIVSTYGPALTVSADMVSVDSFHVEGGVRLDHVEKALLTEVTVSNPGPVGIEMMGTNQSRVAGMALQASTGGQSSGSIGIRISSSRDNEVGRANQISGFQVGILVESNSQRNIIKENEISSGEIGVAVEASYGNILDHNTMSQLTGPAVLVQSGSSANDLLGNEIYQAEMGLVISDGAEGRLERNKVSTRRSAISIANFQGIYLKNNSISSQVEPALLLQSGVVNTVISDNQFLGSPVGLLANGIQSFQVLRNRFSNGGIGVQLTGGTSGEVSENHFWQQFGPGMIVTSSPNLTISRNQFLKGPDWART